MEWLALISTALKSYNLTLEKADELISYFKKAEEAGWFQKTAEAFKPLETGKSTTKEEKDNAAKAIADAIHSL